jgi:TolB-like protein
VSITVTHLLSTSAGRRQMVHTGRVEPSADDIRLQLDRIVGSSMFANADRMTSFLRFVVERALAGEGDQLKEYVVGVAVFGRTDDYDPRLDSIVRVEARRLRTKLDEYYAGDGRDDAVAIRIPRGSYVPVFERRETVPVASPIVPADTKPTIARRNWRPGLTALALVLLAALPLSLVAWRAGFGASVGRATPIVTVGVLPFNEYSADAADELLAAQLTDGVTSELARNRALGVASYTSAQQFAGARRPLPEIAQALKVEMILEGSVTRTGDRVRVEGRLVDVASNRKIWVDEFNGSVADVKDIQRRVAAAAARAAEQARSR